MKHIFLGGGSVVAEYHMPALRWIGNIDGTIVVEKSAASRKAITSAFPSVTCIDEDYIAFLDALPAPDAARPDCVVIALPNQFHVDAAARAIDKGRDVLCEKPLALTASECAGLRAHALAKGRLLKIAMSRRYLPSLMLARGMVVAGELGAVRTIEVHDCAPFLWRPRSFAFFAPEAGGILADMGVHYLDYLETLVGPLTPIDYTDDAKGGIESSLTYRLVANDTQVTVRLSRIEQSGGYIHIGCERGSILIDKSDEASIAVTPENGAARRVSLTQPFDRAEWPSDYRGSFCQLLMDFGRAAAGAATPIADVVDAERTAALIEWAYERRGKPASIRRGQPVLVTGATGFIGGHLVERLSAATDQAIRVTARSPGTCANVARFPVEIVPTDFLDTAAVKHAVAGTRIVYHLAYGNDGADPGRITIDGTKNVVEAAIEAGAECVVVLSTMYVFGFPQTGRAVDESFPYSPYGGVYGKTKAVMERWCLERAKTSGSTRIIVLNPTCVFGPAGGAYTTLPVNLTKLGQFCWIEGGAGFANYIYIDNLIDAVIAAAQTHKAHGQRFILNDGTTTWRELIEPMLGPYAAGVPAYTLQELETLPRHGGPFRLRDLASAAFNAPQVRRVIKRSRLMRAAFAFQSRLLADPNAPPFTGTPAETEAPVFPPEWLGPLFGVQKVTFSAAKAQAVLGWTPKIDLPAALGATVQWLADTGYLPPAK